MESDRHYSKKLVKSSSNQLLTGVCSGLSEYFHIDVSFVRFIFIIFAFLSLSSIVLYILFSAVIPVEKINIDESITKQKQESNIAIIATIFLLFAAILLINYFNIPLFINIWSISFIISLAFFLLVSGLMLSYLLYLKFDFDHDFTKLKRLRSDRIISGVLGGLAEFFDIDSHLLRVIVLSISVFLIKLLPLFVMIYLLLTILFTYED